MHISQSPRNGKYVIILSTAQLQKMRKDSENKRIWTKKAELCSCCLRLVFILVESDAGTSSKKMEHIATKQEIENLARKFGVKLELFYPKK